MTTSKSLTNSLILSTIVACFGSIQYGYHMAELNAPQQVLSCQIDLPPVNIPYSSTWAGSHNLAKCIQMDDAQVGLVTSIFSIGGLIGSFYAGSLADRYGRKRVSFGNALLATLGSFALYISNTYTQLLCARTLCGIAAGSSIVVTPLFISEISPPHLKGVLGSMNQVSINIGILLTQLLALRWSNSYQWRNLLFVGSFIGFINVVMLLFVHESPRWLLSKGKTTKAEESLSWLRGDKEQAREELSEWAYSNSRSHQPTISFGEYVTSSVYRNSRTIVTAVLTGQQFCGINVIIFYGVKVMADLVPQYAIAINVLISILNVVTTFAGAPLIDNLGRKPLLKFSSSMMGVSSFFISLGILAGSSVLLVLSVFVYIGTFALGVGPIPFLLISEVTQPEALGVAQSYGTTCNWIATFLVGFLFPILNQWFGGYVFLLFTVFAASFAVFIDRRVPETKGKKDYTQVWGERTSE